MQEAPFGEVVGKICEKDQRYDPDAYAFVREALDYTAKMLERPAEGPERHVSGQELLEGIRMYAMQEFGAMTLSVFNAWGINKTEDFGEIVFNLVDAKKLGKTDEDTKDDFAGVYDFEEAFVRPFEPKNPVPQ